MSLFITGATVIDAVSEKPLEGHSIWIEGSRIRAIAPRSQLPVPTGVQVIDARGQFIIPGLMNANVHLFAAFTVETIVRHMGCYEDLVAEAAQVALKVGMTTVFDTWGPRRFLMNVRDRINSGKQIGSRIFCAGNILGFDGPFSPDFLPKAAEIVSPILTNRINAIWVENVGRHLMWLRPDQVAREVRDYIGKGIDFVKYAANDHYPGAFLSFSPAVQAAIIEEAHRAGLTGQAHSLSVEGLRTAIEAGCDLITHCNVTGPVTIPESTLELFSKHHTGAVVFAWTQRGLDWVAANCADLEWRVADQNARLLIQSDAMLLLANDGAIYPHEMASDPAWAKWSVGAPAEFNLFSLQRGHFLWLEAMEEKGCAPLRMLQAATRNIAIAYGKDKDLGTLEAGKIADLLILDKNPLMGAANYRSIHTIIKEGAIVDKDSLPTHPMLTRPPEAPAEEEASYKPFTTVGKLPLCPMCMRH
jgi:imidazolonepropionase-like amidohydrolase